VATKRTSSAQKINVLSEQLADAQAVTKVVKAVQGAASTREAAKAALDAVKDAFGWAYGSYWQVDQDAKALKFVVDSGRVTPEFHEVTESASFAYGVGLSGRTWQKRDLYFVEDLGEMHDCCRRESAMRAGVKSGVCFPIVQAGEVVGTMDFFALEVLQPSEERLEALREVGRLVSQAFGQIAAIEEQREAARDVEAVNRVLSALSDAESVEGAAKRALETVKEAFGWAYGSYWKVNPESHALEFAVDSGRVTDEFHRVTATASFAEGVGLSGRTWQRRDLYFVKDLGEMTDCCRRESAVRAGVKSGVCFPIVVGGEVVGTMDFFALEELSPSEGRLEALRNVGRLVSQSMERLAEVERQRVAQESADTLQQAVTNSSAPLMMIDRDFVITYANNATIELLSRHEETLRSIYPGFSAKNVVGACIDVFHKNPSHQRRLLDDPSRLPYKTKITVGPLRFSLNVTAITNAKGEYVGNMLDWQEITAQEEAENKAEILRQAVTNASTPLMMIDRDFVITYANDATLQLLSKHESTMREVYPGFSASKIVGACIDVFHKSPSHQRNLLADPSRLPYKTKIRVGPLRFSLNVTAINGTDGTYLGNTLEWQDITAQEDAEHQIDALIREAAAGNLDKRLEAQGWTGFLQVVGEGVNTMLDAFVAPMRETTSVVGALSKGDLTQESDGEYEGAFKELSDALNSSLGNLRGMVGQIREGAGRIAQGAGELNEGNSNLSSRTQQQAAALEETAATIEQMTGTVKQNADNAAQANQLAAEARAVAEKGGQVVGQAVSAMSEINSSSKKISDIIGVIDEIAFQTNLLALNAAVEAARAGEQGRGFAVVAAEVRNLAQRSAGAAKEIKALIKDSVAKVEDGSRLVDQSGATLEEIVAGVKKVSDIIAEIAAASDEQAQGIEQVNKAVTQMDEMTQQNAALVEEAAAASSSMDEQADNLQQLVSFFRVDDSEQSAPRQAVAATPRVKKPAASSPAAEAYVSAGHDDFDFDEMTEF
jgi:methyl-accepting chemotaxis protein